MSTKTEKLGLIKPELSDPANITLTNENWDKIDTLVYGEHNKPTAEDVGLGVVDVSSDFGTTVNGATVTEKKVYKQGNVVSGTLRLKDINSQGVVILNKATVKPIHNVLANVIATTKDFDYVQSGLFIIDENGNASYSLFDSTVTDVLVSFSYICK